MVLLIDYIWESLMHDFHTLTASKSSLTGSWSWAQGFLKCWSDSWRDLTISPCNKMNTATKTSLRKKKLKRRNKRRKKRVTKAQKVSTTLESTSQIFLRVCSTGAFACKEINWNLIKNIKKNLQGNNKSSYALAPVWTSQELLTLLYQFQPSVTNYKTC